MTQAYAKDATVQASNRMLAPAIWLVLTLALTALIYSRGWSGAFLFDDLPAFNANPLMQIDGRDFDQWRVAAQSSSAGPLGRPVAMLSFAAHHALQGHFDVVAFKAVNTLVHVLTGLLMFLLTRQLLAVPVAGVRPGQGARRLALLAAALWLLHPLHVSTVLYSVQRMAQLSTLFCVAGLWVFARYRSRWAESGASAGEVLAGALWLLLFTILALLSKENGVLLPWLAAVCEITLYRGRWHGRRLPALAVLGWLAFALPLLLMVALSFAQPAAIFAKYAARDFDLVERLLTQTRVLWDYLQLLVWPQPHAMGFQHDDFALSTGLLQPLTTLLALLGWCLALALAALYWRRVPLLAFALLFFLVAHSLESSIIPLELFYEHRNYLPSYAVCLLLAWALLQIGRRVSRPVALGVVALPLLLLTVGLAARVGTWSDDLRLARVNAARHPGSARSQYFLANSLLRQYRARESLGLSDEEASHAAALARHHFELMLRNDPGEISALAMLHYVDSLLYRDSEIRRDWLGQLLSLLDGRPLSASSLNALVLIAECLGDATCDGGEAALRDMEERLVTRYDYRSMAAFLRLRFLVAAEAPLVTQQEAMDHYLAIPGADPLVLSEAARNNLALGRRTGFYDALLRWFRADDAARYIQSQKALLHAAR